MKDVFDIEDKDEGNHDKQTNHMVLGMLAGLLVGSLEMTFFAMVGQIAWGGLSVGVGLLIGMIIGMSIPRKK